MFCAKYVPIVERERLEQEYMSLKQMESVKEITRMFIERALLWLEDAALEQAQMSRYLSMLKMEIQ